MEVLVDPRLLQPGQNLGEQYVEGSRDDLRGLLGGSRCPGQSGGQETTFWEAWEYWLSAHRPSLSIWCSYRLWSSSVWISSTMRASRSSDWYGSISRLQTGHLSLHMQDQVLDHSEGGSPWASRPSWSQR